MRVIQSWGVSIEIGLIHDTHAWSSAALPLIGGRAAHA
jgi:hypothetical protein